MSKRCTICGSYNTEPAVINYVGRGFLHLGRFAVAAVAETAGSLLGPSVGKAAGHTVLKNTKPGEFKSHRCNSCGNYFKPDSED